MPFLTWNESLRLGVEAIDSEHETLLAMLNGVLEAGDEAPTAQDGAEFIDRLLALAVDHFRHEEELMVRLGYPELESHRRAHVKLREQARFLKKVLEGEENPALVRVELAGFLSEWLSDHLEGMELLLLPYIQHHIALNGPL